MADIINKHALIVYIDFDTNNYEWRPFAVPNYGDHYSREVTEWEQECLNTANGFMRRLFCIPEFLSFFKENHYCVKKNDAIHFLKSQGYEIAFPDSREYWEPFSWTWCQLNVRNKPGCVLDHKGWIYDKLATPIVTVSAYNKDYQPFIPEDMECVYIGDISALAYPVCEASKYNIPYLYSLREKVSQYSLIEYGHCIEDFPGLSEVLEYMDKEALPVFNVIVDEDNVVCNAGEYKIHILNLDELKRVVKINKKEIISILEQATT